MVEVVQLLYIGSYPVESSAALQNHSADCSTMQQVTLKEVQLQTGHLVKSSDHPVESSAAVIPVENSATHTLQVSL